MQEGFQQPPACRHLTMSLVWVATLQPRLMRANPNQTFSTSAATSSCMWPLQMSLIIDINPIWKAAFMWHKANREMVGRAAQWATQTRQEWCGRLEQNGYSSVPRPPLWGASWSVCNIEPSIWSLPCSHALTLCEIYSDRIKSFLDQTLHSSTKKTEKLQIANITW